MLPSIEAANLKNVSSFQFMCIGLLKLGSPSSLFSPNHAYDNQIIAKILRSVKFASGSTMSKGYISSIDIVFSNQPTVP